MVTVVYLENLSTIPFKISRLQDTGTTDFFCSFNLHVYFVLVSCSLTFTRLLVWIHRVQAMRANSILGGAPSSEPMCAVPSWALSNATGILMDHQCHFLKKNSWLGVFLFCLAAEGRQEPQGFLCFFVCFETVPLSLQLTLNV